MSECLIVHILKGPPLITNKAGITKAKKRVSEVVKAAKRVYKNFEKADKGARAYAKDAVLLEPMMVVEQYSSYREALDVIEVMALTKPNKLVNEIVEWWNGCGAGDTAWRMDPDNKSVKIVVCGEATWGGSPEGEGFNLMQEAWRFDIPRMLGIR